MHFSDLPLEPYGSRPSWQRYSWGHFTFNKNRMPPHTPIKNLKRQLRSQLRSSRKKLNAKQRMAASRAIVQRIKSSLAFICAQKVALYWPTAEEADPRALMTNSLSNIRATPLKQWYLPVINQYGMQFYRYSPGDKLIVNRYGIPEPQWQNVAPIKPWQLDLVVVPLVGFDQQKTRLGMGGGFYDRYFDRKNLKIKKPYFLGLGFECQKSETELPREEWDLILDKVATERHWY